MKLEECKKCKFHICFYYDEVLCNFTSHLESVPAKIVDDDLNIHILACPQNEGLRSAV